jgi:hypothetical protein
VKKGLLKFLAAVMAGSAALVIVSAVKAGDNDNALKPHATVSTIVSTVPPSNGDVNPYGVFRVPRTVGQLNEGDILVSNFNNSSNLQGTTIVDISPSGTLNVFAQIDASKLTGPCPGGVGLTTALVALRSGWVIVGSLPTSDGSSATAQAGCLIVLNSAGTPLETFYGSLINGPWDATVAEEGGLLDTAGVPEGAGALFGLAFNSDGQIVFVDDNSNTLNLIH